MLMQKGFYVTVYYIADIFGGWSLLFAKMEA